MEQHREQDEPLWTGPERTESSFKSGPDHGQNKSTIKWIVNGIKRRLSKICQRYYIFSLDLTTYDYPADLRHDLVVRRATPEEFRKMAADPVFEVSDYELKNSLEIMAEGDQCWVAELAGRIGFYVFVQFKSRFFSPNCQVPIAPDAVYLIRMVTVADLRGQRLAPSTVAWLAMKFKAEGYARFLTDIASHNRPSLRYAEHVGYTRIGSFLDNTLGRQRRVLLSRRLKRMISQTPE